MFLKEIFFQKLPFGLRLKAKQTYPLASDQSCAWATGSALAMVNSMSRAPAVHTEERKTRNKRF